MQLVLISGLSGSGKSIALNALEDSGYYCVDNLPGQLLEQSVELLRRAGHDRVAMSIDARTGESLELVPNYVSAREREILAPVGEIGHRIDTSDLLPNALRGWIKELLGIRAESTMLLFESFS